MIIHIHRDTKIGVDHFNLAKSKAASTLCYRNFWENSVRINLALIGEIKFLKLIEILGNRTINIVQNYLYDSAAFSSVQEWIK